MCMIWLSGLCVCMCVCVCVCACVCVYVCVCVRVHEYNSYALGQVLLVQTNLVIFHILQPNIFSDFLILLR